MREMSSTERAYLAGLMDGEAYVGITRSKTSKSAKGCKRGISYRVMVSVAMTTSKPLRFAWTVSGLGSVRRRKVASGCKPAWVWNVWSQEAAQLLSSVVSLMHVKDKAARVCIEFQSLMRSPGKNGLTDKEWSRRETLWKKTKVRK